VESGKKIVVGVNKFRDEETSTPPCSASTRRANGASAPACRRFGRSAMAAVWEPLWAVSRTALAARQNLMPPIIEAVKAYATVGEICDRLRASGASTGS